VSSSLRSPLRAALATKGFPRVLTALAASSYGFIVSQLALSWAALDSTGSSFAVGLVFALRLTPPLLFGLMGGRLSDLVDRRRLVLALNILAAAFAIVVAVLGGGLHPSFALLLVASLVLGVLDTPRISASQALVYDVAGREAGVGALALANLTAHLVGVVAGLAGGFALSGYGLPAVFVTVAIAHGFGALLLVGGIRPGERLGGLRARPFSADPLAPFGSESATPGYGTWADGSASGAMSGTGIGAVLTSGIIRVIAAAAVVAEVFAFSSVVLLPAFSESIFVLGAGGLGLMFAVRSVGAVVGLLSLPIAKARLGGGTLLLALMGLFGLSLLAFSLSHSVALAFVALGAVGAAGAAIDALNQTLLQENVPEPSRGSAMGVWVSAIGTGPIGHLEIGALAALLGPAGAQSLNALALVAATIVLAVLTPMRRLR
jgi:MFS family permease